MTQRPLRGRLLIANPALSDPNFDRTVVLLLEYDLEEGSVGLVLNRPTPLPVASALEWLDPLSSRPRVVFGGGPVSPDTAVALGHVRAAHIDSDDFIHTGGVQVADLSLEATELAQRFHDLRVYSGYSGWSPGQLEEELSVEGWWIADPEPDDILTPEPSALWRRVMARQPGKRAWLANYPPDPSLN